MNIEENITRKSNLEIDDSLSCFMGHCAQQTHNAYRVFYDFLEEVKPSRILEIGTALGGFTQFLKISVDNLKLNTKILTYDIHSRQWYPDLIKNGIDLRVEDIFSENYISCKQEVLDFIKSDGVTIVLCDGGNKISEFKLLSKSLKIGDYILAHDYATDREIFETHINKKIWNWIEVTESDIEDTCKSNGLVDFKKDKFNSAVWTCKKKTS